eukprot:123503-Rhodomonas_salina.2
MHAGGPTMVASRRSTPMHTECAASAHLIPCRCTPGMWRVCTKTQRWVLSSCTRLPAEGAVRPSTPVQRLALGRLQRRRAPGNSCGISRSVMRP